MNFSLPAISASAPGLAFPVVGADVLEAHGRGLPLVGSPHDDGRIGPVLLQFVEDLVELGHRLRRRGADLLEGVLVVHEAVNDRRHRHAEGRLAVVGRPRDLGHVREIVHTLEIVHAVELMLQVLVERTVEGTACYKITRSAAVEARIERGVVVGRRGGRELDLDVGIMLVEGRYDLRVPDVGVVVAPALDLQ